MRIAVVSDLHLAAEPSVCRAGRSERSLLRFVDQLAANHDRVVLLGDIWETLAPRQRGDERRELERAAAAWPGFASRLRDPTFVYLHGNHDLVARDVWGTSETWELEADGQRLLFCHGHQFDRFSSHGSSEAAFWAVGWLMRAGLRTVVERLDGVDQILGGAHRLQTRCLVQQRAVTAARAQAIDVVVTGHTHLGGCFDHGDCWFLNSGTGAGGLESFLSLDTRSARWRWHDGAARVSRPAVRRPVWVQQPGLSGRPISYSPEVPWSAFLPRSRPNVGTTTATTIRAM